MDVPAYTYYVPPILRLHPEIGGMFVDNMDMLTLTRWRLTCKMNYDQTVASLRRTLLTMLGQFAPKPIVILGILTRHRAILGGEFALAFILRDYSMVPKHLDIYASDYEYRGVCRSIVKHRTFPGFVVKEEYINNSVLDAMRTFVTCKLVIHTKMGTMIRVSRSFTSSATAPLTHASCTALSNFVTEFGFGCSHPILTLKRRALLADQELPHLPFQDQEAHDELERHGFLLAMSPADWPEFRRGDLGGVVLGPVRGSSAASAVGPRMDSDTGSPSEFSGTRLGVVADAVGTSMIVTGEDTIFGTGDQTGTYLEATPVAPVSMVTGACAPSCEDVRTRDSMGPDDGDGSFAYNASSLDGSDVKLASYNDGVRLSDSAICANGLVSTECCPCTTCSCPAGTDWSGCMDGCACTTAQATGLGDSEDGLDGACLLRAAAGRPPEDHGSEEPNDIRVDAELDGADAEAVGARFRLVEATWSDASLECGGSGDVSSNASDVLDMHVVKSGFVRSAMSPVGVDDVLHPDICASSTVAYAPNTSGHDGLGDSATDTRFEPAMSYEEGELASPGPPSVVPHGFHPEAVGDMADAIRRGDVIGTDEPSVRLSATGWYVNVTDRVIASNVHDTVGLEEAVGTSYPDPRAASEGVDFDGSTLDSEESEEDGSGGDERMPGARKEVQDCWRHRYICPSQGRFFGDHGSMVEFFDPLRGGEEFCAQNSVVPFGPMVVWRVLSTFVCERGCNVYNDALDAEPSAIPVMIRRNPFDEGMDVPEERTVDVIYRYRSSTP